MAQTRQFGVVSDIDDAPDIYETPELTDDASTVPASTTIRSPSSASSYGEAPEDATGIDRRRVGADEARSRFEPTRVNADNVDFSGKLSRYQRSYHVTSRRRRRAEVAEDTGDFSEEEDESLEHKLARLRQEIEEVKAELDARDAAQPDDGAEKSDDVAHPEAAAVQKLSELLDSAYTRTKGAPTGAEAQYMAALQRLSSPASGVPSTATTADAQNGALAVPDQGISVEQRAQILSKASEVDQRLAALESALGLDGSASSDPSLDAPKPVLYTLNDLDRQLAALASPSSSDALDTASHRIRQLTQEADRLAERRRAAAASPGSSTTPTSTRDSNVNGSTSGREPDGTSKINALFGTLPTIENLSPSLPLVLERLRTLRLIHASAGDASTTLDALEKRQAEQDGEIKQWQDALSKVEASISEGEGVLTGNVKLVSEWVKELETRVEKLH